MKKSERRLIPCYGVILLLAAFLLRSAMPAEAGEYENSLKGVTGIKAVYEVSQGSPRVANGVFWAVRNSYLDETVQALPDKAQVVVVFHGPAVRLLSSVRDGFEEEDYPDLDRFQQTLRQMKEEGVKLEVCLYAAKVMGVEATTILPGIDPVGNGFISVIGYQAQGYGVVRIP